MLVLLCGIECTPCNVCFVTWLDLPILQYWIASMLKECQGCCNYHQCSVGASCVGLYEPCAALALWLGSMQPYYGTWTQTLITQSSIIRCIGGSSPSKLHQFCKMASILKECEGLIIHISGMLVLLCGIECTPCNLGSMAWLDWPLLQYWIASILKGCEGVVIIISAVLVLVLLDCVNPAHLWPCGLVRRSITVVRELRPWSLSHR